MEQASAYLSDDRIQEVILSTLHKNYTLCYVDYRSNLDHEMKKFQEVFDLDTQGLKEGKSSPWDVLDDFDRDDWIGESNYQAIKQIKDTELKPAIISALENLPFNDRPEDPEAEAESILEAKSDFINEECYQRDDSHPMREMLKNTSDIKFVAFLGCNYDGAWSHYSMSNSGYEYCDGLKLIIDQLQMNPAEVKREMIKNEWSVKGRWPNKPKRDPLVSLHDFLRELENTATESNHLVFIGEIDASDIPKYRGDVKFLKGSALGLYDQRSGGGSILEMTLLRDYTLTNQKVVGPSPYDKWKFYVDSAMHYSIDNVYGLTKKGWGGYVLIPDLETEDGN